MNGTSFLFAGGRWGLSWVLALVAPWACADETGMHAMTFTLHAPQARSVEILGDFNQWQSGATPLAGPDETGRWRVRLALPAAVGRIEYTYWVDGAHRQVDPDQPVVLDGFSGENNVVMLP